MTAGRGLALLLVGMVLTACGGGAAAPSPSGSANPEFVAQVASFQLLAGRPNRVLVGLLGNDERWVSFGSASLRFVRADDPSVAIAPVQAAFLPLPGTPDGAGQLPQLTLPADGRGVYAASGVTFPSAGYWQVTASLTIDGRAQEADATFEVFADPQVPTIGDEAPSVDNPVLGDNVDPVVLDSRAQGGIPLPDPQLHRVSIADALAAHRPALVVFSTPVYCTSRFCGPVTDMVAQIANEDHGDVAFIHVEIWSDFTAGVQNPAAKAWLTMADGDIREPWTFLVGADGRIVGSWDNVVTRGELEAALAALP